MNIIRNDKLATWILVPVEEGEREVLASIAALLKPEDKLSYSGMEKYDSKKFCLIHLHAGAKEERPSKTEGNVTIIKTVYTGGVELILRGSTAEDKEEMWSIRLGCRYSGCLIFLGETDVNGKKAIITTAGRCKHCGAALLEPEWQTCDSPLGKLSHLTGSPVATRNLFDATFQHSGIYATSYGQEHDLLVRAPFLITAIFYV